MFAADSAVQRLVCALTELDCHIHELADADRVELGEGIELIDLARIVRRQEFSGVVARETEGHLREVVGAEAEEIGLFGYIVGGAQCCGL